MKYFFGICFFLFFNCFTSAQTFEAPQVRSVNTPGLENFTGLLTEDYATGQPKMRREVKNGKAEGLWLEWYPTGVLRYRAYWKNNKGEGKWEYFHPNGQVSSIFVYEEDLPVGLCREFHENGQLASEATYLRGKLTGKKITYDAAGTILKEEMYAEGVQLIHRPIPFAEGIISTQKNQEFGLCFAPDGNELYLCRRAEGKEEQKIYRSKKTERGWSRPRVCDFSTGTDEGPHISTDGKRFYFASTRPIPGRKESYYFDMNLWYMDREGESWSEPRALSEEINHIVEPEDNWPRHYEANPTTDEQGNLYYWTRGQNARPTDIYTAELKKDGSFAPPLPLPAPVNTETGYETSPVFTKDGQYMIFASSNREDSYGGEDLYYSKKVAGKWSEPVNLGPEINSQRTESSPVFSPDGKYFYFASDRGEAKDAEGNPIWNIYYIETQFLQVGY